MHGAAADTDTQLRDTRSFSPVSTTERPRIPRQLSHGPLLDADSLWFDGMGKLNQWREWQRRELKAFQDTSYADQAENARMQREHKQQLDARDARIAELELELSKALQQAGAAKAAAQLQIGIAATQPQKAPAAQPAVALVQRLWGTRGQFDFEWNDSMIADSLAQLDHALAELVPDLCQLLLLDGSDPASALLEWSPVALEGGERLELVRKAASKALDTKELRVAEALLRSCLVEALAHMVWRSPFHGLPQQVRWRPPVEGRATAASGELVALLKQGYPDAGEGPQRAWVPADAEWVEAALRFYRDQARHIYQRFCTMFEQQQQQQQQQQGAHADSEAQVQLGPGGAAAGAGLGQAQQQQQQPQPQQHAAAIPGCLQEWQCSVAARLVACAFMDPVHMPRAQYDTYVGQLVQHMKEFQPSLWQRALDVAAEAIKLQLLTPAVHPELVVSLVPAGTVIDQSMSKIVEEERSVQVVAKAIWAPRAGRLDGTPVEPGRVLVSLLPAVRYLDHSEVLAKAQVRCTAAGAMGERKGLVLS